MTDLAVLAPELGGVALAALLGAAVGAERQVRARSAGLRTNALVALGAALFVVMGARSFEGEQVDPTRVAAQIASGVGFIGAGVIMKHGASISGLNSAATIWVAAAVGALAGGGLPLVAAAGAALVILVNVGLRPLGLVLDRAPEAARESSETDYRLTVTCATRHEAEIRRLAFDAVHRSPFVLRSIAAEDEAHERVCIEITASAGGRDDLAMEAAIARIVTAPEVLGILWTAETPEAVGD
ncbi:MgtC/SapB family protein [Frigoribacterium sp. PvP032]|uniref:MgtC/SapB family protein n=1 Tax=Frigoribacterium sp. PvP032 TaxID=2806589 RepID=UPI001B6ED1FA|nr:MgtC/SapB family protein [Frigoribacterium sp. PvP032]MBP1189051.1 putative Mg2+ transporter-C (MgtC) family protein [Frigoribacterium sp. PvP032]